jgi:heat shock protein HslJ
MTHRLFTSIAMTTLLVASLSIAATAQDGSTTPEGTEWHLEGYAVEGEVGIVPWHIEATLLLEDGTASGSSGCNQFSGSYTLEGEGLTFDPALATTRMACPEDQSAIEAAYMANLPQTAAWAISEGALSLTDADGGPLLDFEQTVVGLTTSDVAVMAMRFAQQQAEIDGLTKRIDSIRIGTLRDRIKALETQVKTLRATATTASTTYNASEKVLLKGVPSNIARTCSPLRGSGLPTGTVAALQCRPSANQASDMAYYLMEYDNAKRTFQKVMNGNSVPNRLRCDRGRSGRALLHPLAAEGCFVDGGRANVRIMYMATSCKQLDAGGTHLVSPVIYVAAEAPNNDIKTLYDWTRAPNRASSVTGTIPAPGQPTTPVCESDF